MVIFSKTIAYHFIGGYMESVIDGNNYGSHEIKIVDRGIISLTGINKISSFDDQEFF